MKDPDDDPLEKEFQARCDAMSEPTQWLIHPTGDTDFEKGVRRGIELALLTIRDSHGKFDLWRRDDGAFWLCLSIYENLTYREDFTKVFQEFIHNYRGGGPDNSEELKAFAVFLRAQADKMDEATEWKPKPRPRRKEEALEKES